MNDFHPPFKSPPFKPHPFNDQSSICFQSFPSPSLPTFNTVPSYASNANVKANVDNLNEIQQLRQQNEMLMKQVNDQQRQIDYLTSQMQNSNSNNSPFTPTKFISVSYCDAAEPKLPTNPLKRRKICSDIMMPPAA